MLLAEKFMVMAVKQQRQDMPAAQLVTAKESRIFSPAVRAMVVVARHRFLILQMKLSKMVFQIL